MKRALFIVIGGLLAAVGCLQEKSSVTPGGEPVNVRFQIGVAEATKALGDGSQALRLTLRIYDQQGNLVQESTADREESESGWTVSAAIVPGTYSFCFWASSPDSGAYGFDGKFLTVDYSKMKPNSDQDDAFWAVLAGKEVTAGFTEPVTLTRPLAQISLYSKDKHNDLSEEDLNDASRFFSSMVFTGASGSGLPTRMNLLDGSTDTPSELVVFDDAPLAALEVSEDNGVALAFDYVLVPADGLTIPEVDFSAPLMRTNPVINLACGTIVNVPLARNKRSLLLYTPGPGDHDSVDMGMRDANDKPIFWATCNVGAENPEDYGDYFAWGETTPKDTYTWSTYIFNPIGDGYTFTKYTTGGATLELADDAASANWGGNWRTPTEAEWDWLLKNCEWAWIDYYFNGVSGIEVTSRVNDNHIFLPAAGYRDDTSLYDGGSYGYYWSSSLSTAYPDGARVVYFYSGAVNRNNDERYFGQSVRAVREE